MAPAINQSIIKSYFQSSYFCAVTSAGDKIKLRFDFTKVMLFNLLYTGGKDRDKIGFLYKLCENANSHYIHSHSQKLQSVIECLIYIPCVLVSEIMSATKSWAYDLDQ